MLLYKKQIILLHSFFYKGGSTSLKSNIRSLMKKMHQELHFYKDFLSKQT